MKKILALLLALMMVLSLAACDLGGNNDNPGGNTDNPGTSQGGEENPGTQGGEENNGGDETPDNTGDASMIADGWDLPAYPYGELVYTGKNDDGVAVTFYFNNTTIEECQEYCQSLANAGLRSVTDSEIYGGTNCEGRYIDYRLMNLNTNASYVVYYDYDNAEHTVNTPDGDVVYQLSISKTS